MQWVRASRPVAAVTCAGTVRMSVGVDEGGVGDEVRADDALLHLLGFVEEDGVGGDFAAGAGGGGDADERQVAGGEQLPMPKASSMRWCCW